MILLHLVSDQTLQNLLPILALRPERIIQVQSNNPRFKKTDQNLVNAAKLFGVEADCFETSLIDSSTPNIEQTRAALTGIKLKDAAIINFTGGTKLMSIAAHQYAKEKGIPTLYVDTQGGQFVSGETGALPDSMPSLAETASKLTVESVLAAHGLDASSLKLEQPKKAQIVFANKAVELRKSSKSDEIIGKYLTQVHKQFRPQERIIDGGKLKDALAKPLPQINHEEEHSLLKTALDAGIVRAGANKEKFYLNPDPAFPQKGRKLKHAAEENLKLLEGGWFEIYVYDRMNQSGKFLDLKWEVQGREDKTFGENDIVGIDRHSHFSIIFVSCKVSDEHISALEHVLSTRQRSLRFGGTFSKTAFAFFKTKKDSNKRQTIKDACDALQSQCFFGLDELKKWLASG